MQSEFNALQGVIYMTQQTWSKSLNKQESLKINAKKIIFGSK